MANSRVDLTSMAEPPRPMLEDGYHRFEWSNGDAYDGHWKLNCRHGDGVMRWAAGGAYEGEWRRGRPHGKGKRTWTDGSWYLGDWKEGVMDGDGATMVYADGSRYVGRMFKNMRRDYGVFRAVDGEVYEGQWKKDMRHGTGHLVYADGSEYRGKFVCGNRADGSANMVFADGSRYAGAYTADKRTGEGVYEEPPECTAELRSALGIGGGAGTAVDDATPGGGNGAFEALVDGLLLYESLPPLEDAVGGKEDESGAATLPSSPLAVVAGYTGGFKDDKFHGFGTRVYKDGGTYRGMWRNGQRHIRGAQRWPDGATYVGGYNMGHFSGVGTLRLADGDTYTGEWHRGKRSGRGVRAYAPAPLDGRRFDGEWEADHIVRGRMEYADGAVVEGDFKQGRPHGEASMRHHPCEATYKGQWRDGMPWGNGRLEWPNGDTYVGEWVHAEPHGEGTFTRVDGLAYTGTWRYSQAHGRGALTLPNGLGELNDAGFRNGKPHGAAVVRWRGGRDEEVRFAHGRLVPNEAALVPLSTEAALREHAPDAARRAPPPGPDDEEDGSDGDGSDGVDTQLDAATVVTDGDGSVESEAHEAVDTSKMSWLQKKRHTLEVQAKRRQAERRETAQQKKKEQEEAKAAADAALQVRLAEEQEAFDKAKEEEAQRVAEALEAKRVKDVEQAKRSLEDAQRKLQRIVDARDKRFAKERVKNEKAWQKYLKKKAKDEEKAVKRAAQAAAKAAKAEEKAKKAAEKAAARAAAQRKKEEAAAAKKLRKREERARRLGLPWPPESSDDDDDDFEDAAEEESGEEGGADGARGSGHSDARDSDDNGAGGHNGSGGSDGGGGSDKGVGSPTAAGGSTATPTGASDGGGDDDGGAVAGGAGESISGGVHAEGDVQASGDDVPAGAAGKPPLSDAGGSVEGKAASEDGMDGEAKASSSSTGSPRVTADSTAPDGTTPDADKGKDAAAVQSETKDMPEGSDEDVRSGKDDDDGDDEAAGDDDGDDASGPNADGDDGEGSNGNGSADAGSDSKGDDGGGDGDGKGDEGVEEGKDAAEEDQKKDEPPPEPTGPEEPVETPKETAAREAAEKVLADAEAHLAATEARVAEEREDVAEEQRLEEEAERRAVAEAAEEAKQAEADALRAAELAELNKPFSRRGPWLILECGERREDGDVLERLGTALLFGVERHAGFGAERLLRVLREAAEDAAASTQTELMAVFIIGEAGAVEGSFSAGDGHTVRVEDACAALEGLDSDVPRFLCVLAADEDAAGGSKRTLATRDSTHRVVGAARASKESAPGSATDSKEGPVAFDASWVPAEPRAGVDEMWTTSRAFVPLQRNLGLVYAPVPADLAWVREEERRGDQRPQGSHFVSALVDVFLDRCWREGASLRTMVQRVARALSQRGKRNARRHPEPLIRWFMLGEVVQWSKKPDWWELPPLPEYDPRAEAIKENLERRRSQASAAALVDVPDAAAPAGASGGAGAGAP